MSEKFLLRICDQIDQQSILGAILAGHWDRGRLCSLFHMVGTEEGQQGRCLVCSRWTSTVITGSLQLLPLIRP